MDGGHINQTYSLSANSQYIAVKNEFKVIIYNLNGEIVSIINNYGIGPGEYPGITEMEIGNDGKSVLIFSWKSAYRYRLEDAVLIEKI